MKSGFDPGALLARSFVLPRGPRVRLRLLGPRDGHAVRDLGFRTGSELSELELARLVRFDPRTRVVICAAALLNGREALVGVGAITLNESSELTPDTMLVDGALSEGLDELLRQALVGRARALVRARAA